MLTNIPVEEVIKLIKCAYDNNHHRLCIETSLIWLQANNIYNDDKISRIDNPYLSEIFEKLTVVCYYVPKYRNMGYFLTEFLLLNDIKVNKPMIQINREFYAEKLNCSNTRKLDLNDYPLLWPKQIGTKYISINPSILKIEEGYLVNCRLINYLRPREILWDMLDIDNKIRSKNIILILDNEFNKIDEYELLDKSWRQNLDTSKLNVIGIEDLILFKHQNEISCSFTSLDSEPIGQPKQNIGKLKEENDKYVIEDVKVMHTGLNHPEKNWLYINVDDEIKFIHSHREFGVRLINVDNIIEDINQGINLPGLNNFRGSAPPIPFSFNDDEGWLSVIHEVIKRRDDNGLCYLHRFVFYTKEMHIKYISKIFYFEHRGIEFCRSMCYSHDAHIIVIGVGIQDLTAKLFDIHIDTIKSMLIPLSKFQFQ